MQQIDKYIRTTKLHVLNNMDKKKIITALQVINLSKNN